MTKINYNNFFLLKINPEINFKDHFNELIKFQIKRFNHFFPKSIGFYDPENLLKKNDFELNNVFRTPKDILNKKDVFKKNDFIFLVESINPIIDTKIINSINKQFDDVDSVIGIKGAVPGTAPNIAITPKFFIENISSFDLFGYDLNDSKIFYHNTQRIFNNLFDLRRPIRLKIFSSLIHKNKNLFKYTLEEFIKYLESENVFNFILNYGNKKIRVEKYTNCPNCKHEHIKPLYFSSSQPMIGFLDSKKSIYFQCLNCSLVFLRNQCKLTDIGLLYDDYERPKVNESKLIESYLENKGPSHQKEKVQSLELIESLIGKKGKMIDLAGGFGEFSCLAKTRNKEWDVTCADFNLNHIQNLLKTYGVKSKNVNILDGNYGNDYDVITALHIIEHIPFDGILTFLKNVKKSLKKDGIFLITTPDFNSPLARIFDYHLLYPPQHQTILSSEWLENFIKVHNLFRKIKQESACVILENYGSWFNYYKNTAPNDEIENMVKIFDYIHEDKKLFNKFEENIFKNNIGSETIMIFKNS